MPRLDIAESSSLQLTPGFCDFRVEIALFTATTSCVCCEARSEVSAVAASTLAADCPNAGAAASIALTDGPTLLARELALDAALSADDDKADAVVAAEPSAVTIEAEPALASPAEVTSAAEDDLAVARSPTTVVELCLAVVTAVAVSVALVSAVAVSVASLPAAPAAAWTPSRMVSRFAKTDSR